MKNQIVYIPALTALAARATQTDVLQLTSDKALMKGSSL
jgi:hypothetical protein